MYTPTISRLALVLAALVVTAPPAHAQFRTVNLVHDDYVNEIRNRLDGFASIAGFRRSHDHFFDWLRQGEDHLVTFQLSADVDYLIVGACDRDCNDLDFALYDENDNLIDEDTATDAIPVVEVTPAWTGPFTLRVNMYHCSINPCQWGVGVYRR